MILYLDAHLRGRPWLIAMNKASTVTKTKVIALVNHSSELRWIQRQALENIVIVDVKKYMSQMEFLDEFPNSFILKNNLRQFILSDRTVRELTAKEANVYVQKWLILLSELDEKYNFTLCIGEPTWLNEMIAFEYFGSKGVRCIEPAPNRFDPTKFLFLEGRTENSILPIIKSNEKTIANWNLQKKLWIERVINSVYRSEKNYILDLNKRDMTADLGYFVKAFKMLSLAYLFDRNKYIHVNIFKAFYRKLIFVIRKRYIKAFLNKVGIVKPPVGRYVFYPLHLQPERTIDAMGCKYSNVLEVIRQISLNWDFDYIVVKEHPTAIGRRPKSFYTQLMKIPSVQLVSSNVDAKTLIHNSDFVYSVSGTALFEAVILGKNAGCGCDAYFTKYLSHGHVSPYVKLMPRSKNQLEVTSLLGEMFENSFDGIVHDEIFMPEANSKINIENLTTAFVDIFHKYGKSAKL